MCGIFGAVGLDSVKKTLVALGNLEYRGYDSAGIAVKSDGQMQIYKTCGRVKNLSVKYGANDTLALGHTRWATHGKVSCDNAHPFVSYDKRFVVVHNGIVENYRQHKLSLQKQGVKFVSQTDSEVVAHLMAKHFDGDVASTLQKVAGLLTGSFAVVVASTVDDCLYAVKRSSPLCVAHADGLGYLCSDVGVMSQYATQVAVLPEEAVVCVSAQGVKAFANGKEVALRYFALQQGTLDQSVEGDHMFSEICQIPTAISDNYRLYFKSGGLNLPKRLIKRFKRVVFVGCGTAYHSGLVADALLRRWCKLDSYCVTASEYVYDDFVTDKNTLVVAISQSGETADTLKAVQKAKQLGATVYAVTNVKNSSLCFLCNYVKYLNAGREVSVASTKAYNCQVLTLTLMMLELALARKQISKQYYQLCLRQFDDVPKAISRILNNKQAYHNLADSYKDVKSVFFVGRRLDIACAKEGSLKLKEISYLPSEAYPSGELKHGTLALMEEGVLVFAICCESDLLDKCANTVAEIVSRGAKVVVVSQYSTDVSDGKASGGVLLPKVSDIFAPIVSVVPLQLFAYYFAKGRGCDVDKPRNLAKSVTVE